MRASEHCHRSLRRAAISLVLVLLALTASTFSVRADSFDPTASAGPFGYSPPSFDPTVHQFVMNGQLFRAPGNFIGVPQKTDSGEVASVSFWALLPDLAALTKDNAHCFLDRKDPCHTDVIMIGLEHEQYVDGNRRLEATRAISKPEKHTGPCGFEYYESLGSVENGSVVFEHYYTKFPGDSDLSLVRCPKEGSPAAAVCNSDGNLDHGNSFYYIFPRAKICEWGDIKRKVLTLIKSFQKVPGVN